MLSIKKIPAFIICTLLFSVAMAQQKTDYTARWKKIDDLVTKKGLPQSALKEVENLYAIAKKENQEAQLIKATLYKISLQENTQENNDTKGIALLETEATNSSGAVNAILYSALADAYYRYFQQNRWRLYNRTQTVNFKKEDIATWTAEDLHKKTSDCYLASLKENSLLQQSKLDKFEPLISKGNVRHLRPTLYDLLSFRALEYFGNDERDISKPSYAFEINNEGYFASAVAFSKIKISTKDESSLHHKALLIYQELLRFHANDTKPDAFIDADIHRIEFVKSKAIMENKDALYLKALEEIQNKYKDFPGASQASYLIARHYSDKASDFQAGNPLRQQQKDAYIKAAAICKKVLTQKDESEGKANCYNLLQEIESKELRLKSEKINTPGQPFRTLVEYRNCGEISLRLIELTEEVKQKLERRDGEDTYWKDLTNLKIIKGWKQLLPVVNDYRTHSTEIKIEALPVGRYILLASVGADFSLQKNPISIQYLYVSNISYINNCEHYFALNRETGQPLANAVIQVWANRYDYNKRMYILSKREYLKSDKNGYFTVAQTKPGEERSLRLEISYEKDHLFLDDEQYISYRGSEEPAIKDAARYEKENARIFLFMDRSIYRPGQTIYFKGIAVTNDFETKKPKLYTNKKTTIILFNANGEVVDSLQTSTNEYGSYSGKFNLPQGVLNGQFRIHDEQIKGDQYFSVEEYKRPKFFVEYEKTKGSYRVNDSVTVTANAKAYAGNNIDGALVKYRVVRTARFIYTWCWSRWGYPATSAMEIAHGTATTNADGKFKITFKAIPDLTIDKSTDPVFDYKIYADVTDINGETRSGETVVPVSYKSLLLSIQLQDDGLQLTDSLKSIGLSTTNINGLFEAAKVKIALYPLTAPITLIRKRYWNRPDQFVMNKGEYRQSFPYDEYDNETDKSTWPKAAAIWSKEDSTKEGKTLNITGTSFKEGWYQIEAITKDKLGNEVKDIKYIYLYDEKNKTLTQSAYMWQTQKKPELEPGEQSTITLGSSLENVFIIQQIQKSSFLGESKPVFNFISLNNEKKDFAFAATEEDRGGYGVTHLFVKHNRFFEIINNISVPWSNKELDISYETFRDKSLPGSEEKWKLKISGSKKEKLAAEMLISMYDASLDQFKPHNWNKPFIWPVYYGNQNWNGQYGFSEVGSNEKHGEETLKSFSKEYDKLFTNDDIQIISGFTNAGAYGNQSMDMMAVRKPGSAARTIARQKGEPMAAAAPLEGKAYGLNVENKNMAKDDEGTKLKEAEVDSNTKKVPENGTSNIQIRKNFNETAFFFPALQTDSEGNVSFGFTIPEALTKWKLQTLAHTKELAMGYSVNNVVTQKPLMVQPNAPRFLREGDKMELSAKVVNLTDKELTGTLQLELLNASNNQSVDGWFRNMSPTQYFTAEGGKSAAVKFTIDVPYQYNSALVYRFVAKAGNNSDGEEAALPVMTNSLLVTESMPLNMRGTGTKNFTFEKLIKSGTGASETLQNHALTVEFTSNPTWYAVQALPYLMEYPYDCAEQTFNRYYANALASSIANASPKLKEVFEKWKTKDTAALLSNLQKNQELKAVLLEETPWVLDAKNEAQQKKNIALLFDMLRMSKELNSAFEKLKQLQSSNGGFTWFKGGPDDRYMTQYIVTGMGHLKKLNALTPTQQLEWKPVLENAIAYLDARIKEDYDFLIRKKIKLNQNNLSYIHVQYLYMRSFFSSEYPSVASCMDAVVYYRKQAQQYWLSQSRYMQGMIALAMYRSGEKPTAENIIKSLEQNSINNEELGMYWKENSGGFYWHQAPIETHSLLIEAFSEISKNTETIDNLKTWLLKQKQTQNWKTTKATADACYALLLQGSNWLPNNPIVEIKLGDKTVSNSTNTDAEAGTGYFKQGFTGPFVNNKMGNITVSVSNKLGTPTSATTWGAVYWQYFERLDKITPAATPLQVNKKLFVENNTGKGPVLEPITEGSSVKVGDKIKVRIELRVDRDMEYVHMKDMRASCMEPVNVLSQYKWQGGLGYYETTKDASTNFFFGWLGKGTYVFEYPLFVTHTGNFSNGITSVQCMYAPEFTSHSEGVRVRVER